MNFIAIDVETANADMASICQIGVVSHQDGVVVEEWSTYVDPEDYFDGINVSIHGIDESVVRGAPTFGNLSSQLFSKLSREVVVCHTHFDRVALLQSARRYGVLHPDIRWLDSARVARRAWTECAQRGYGLRDVCAMLGYTFRHHDALEDARAAAHILRSAIAKSGVDLEGWLTRVDQPIGSGEGGHELTRAGNPLGEFSGEVLVFTGSLRMPRREAADLAAAIGCEVAAGVTKKTTMLVVGDQDIQKLNGNAKSSKHRKAEDLIAKGAAIRILKEGDFLELVRMSGALA